MRPDGESGDGAPVGRRAVTGSRTSTPPRPRTHTQGDVRDTGYPGRVTGAGFCPANSPRGDLSTMLRALILLLPLALTIYAFIDCLNTPENEAKHLPKVAWVVIILLFWIVGPIVWLAAGKVRQGPAGRRAGWVAPDDNPAFLESLKGESGKDAAEKDAGDKDETVLKDWEADLRRREEELKRRESGPEAPPAS